MKKLILIILLLLPLITLSNTSHSEFEIQDFNIHFSSYPIPRDVRIKCDFRALNGFIAIRNIYAGENIQNALRRWDRFMFSYYGKYVDTLEHRPISRIIQIAYRTLYHYPNIDPENYRNLVYDVCLNEMLFRYYFEAYIK